MQNSWHLLSAQHILEGQKVMVEGAWGQGGAAPGPCSPSSDAYELCAPCASQIYPSPGMKEQPVLLKPSSFLGELWLFQSRELP